METGTPTNADIRSDLKEVSLSSRIHNLTDGVFAIAMTLLMLNFRLPFDLPGDQLSQIFSSIAPQMFAYFLSFAALGAFWIADYNHYRFIRGADRPFLWITIFFLSTIALIPASTAVLERYFDSVPVVIAYGAHLILCAVALYSQWNYASRGRKLLIPGTDDSTIERMKNRIRVPVVLNFLGILCAFISPYITLAIFAIVLMLAMIPFTSDRIADSFDGYFLKISTAKATLQ